jgi:hypothetical protein
VKSAADSLNKVPEGTVGLVKPVSTSVIDRLTLPEPPSRMKMLPDKLRVPDDAPGKVLVPPSAENWYADPAAISSEFNVVRSTVP